MPHKNSTPLLIKHHFTAEILWLRHWDTWTELEKTVSLLGTLAQIFCKNGSNTICIPHVLIFFANLVAGKKVFEPLDAPPPAPSATHRA